MNINSFQLRFSVLVIVIPGAFVSPGAGQTPTPALPA